MMSNKILVAYASRAGSTVGVAEMIGETLAEKGAKVDVLPIQDVKDITSYRVVVVGSAIQGKKWLPEAMQFMRIHQKALSQKPFAAFLVCMTLAMPNAEKYRSSVSDWLEPVRTLVRPVSEGLFAGALDINKTLLSAIGLSSVQAYSWAFGQKRIIEIKMRYVHGRRN